MQSINTLGEDLLNYTKTPGLTLGTVKTLTSLITGGIPVGTTRVLLEPEAQAVRIRDDGTAPDATTGWPIAVGSIFEYTADHISGIQILGATSAAILNIWCFGVRAPS